MIARQLYAAQDRFTAIWHGRDDDSRLSILKGNYPRS
jgi:hypothetical protein